jgi:hypothetical protein
MIVGQTPCGPDDLDCNEALPGHGAFQPPPEMWVDTPAVLEFAVGLTIGSLTREMGEAPPPAEVRDVFIGRCMRVTLEPNPAVRIQGPNGVTTRLARDMDRASWSWSVIPLNPGSPTLRARVEILAQRERQCSDRILDQYTERVPVQIRISRWRGFLRALGEAKNFGDVLAALFSSWEGAVAALAALLTALGTLFGTMKLRRRARRNAVKQAD